MIRGEQPRKYREYGEDILAVANLWLQNKQNSNTNKVNSSTNKLKLFRNITEVSTVGNTSMISTLERAIYNTSNQRTKRSENNWKILPEKLLSKKQSYRSKPQGQNSMSLHLISIILRQRKQFLEYIIHLIHS